MKLFFLFQILRNLCAFAQVAQLFPQKIKVIFSTGDVIFSSTCTHELHLPIAFERYDIFEEVMKSITVVNGAAFNTM